MARRPRLQYHGAVYHVMSRGNRKAAIFEDDEDRRRLWTILDDAAVRYNVRFYEVCLMGNHYHLILDTPRDNLSEAMRHVNGEYAQASNRRHRRTGHLFEARFRSIVIQRESYLRRASRYVVRNPVRGGLAAAAIDWPWSTYRATAGFEPAPAWLHLEWLDWAFEAASRAEAQQKYRAFVNNPVSRESRLEPNTLVYGSKAFKKAVEADAKRKQADRPVPQWGRATPPLPLETIFAGVHKRSATRNEQMRVAHVIHGHYITEIAGYLGLHRTAVSKALQRQAKSRRAAPDQH